MTFPSGGVSRTYPFPSSDLLPAGGGVGFQPFYPGVSSGEPKPLESWKLSDNYLPNNNEFPQPVLQEGDFVTLKKGLEASIYRKKPSEQIPALLDGLRRKPADSTFTPPMVIFSEGFTKFAFCSHKIFFQASLRSITGPESDAGLLRFLTAVLGSDLMQYQAFHSGSSNGIGRDKLHLYESLNIPFPLPDHELVAPNAKEIVREVSGIFKEVEAAAATSKRAERAEKALAKIQPLVEEYFSVTEAERILIEDTRTLWQESIHRTNLDKPVPSLAFPKPADRKRYADTLCDVLNRLVRKQGINIYAEGMVSRTLNVIFLTVVFADERKPYEEIEGDTELWKALDRVGKAAQHDNGSFSYLRGFRYFETNRLQMLKPATMRNWCRSAALNDADAIFEYLVRPDA